MTKSDLTADGPTDDRVLIDYPTASAITSFSPKTLYRMYKAGLPLGVVRQGRSIRFHKPTLLRFLESRADKPAGATN